MFNAGHVILEFVKLLVSVSLLQLLSQLFVIGPGRVVSSQLLGLDLILGDTGRSHVSAVHRVQLFLLIIQVIDPGDHVGARARLVIGLLGSSTLAFFLDLAPLLVQSERSVAIHDRFGSLVLVQSDSVVPGLAGLFGHLLAGDRIDQRSASTWLSPLFFIQEM